jgi:hypothetical protein
MLERHAFSREDGLNHRHPINPVSSRVVEVDYDEIRTRKIRTWIGRGAPRRQTGDAEDGEENTY